MKQPRRWAALLAALLMAASLVFAPREGSAGPVSGRAEPGDAPQGEEMQEPEVPVHPGPNAVDRRFLPLELFARTLRVDLLGVFMIATAPLTSDLVTRDAASLIVK